MSQTQWALVVEDDGAIRDALSELLEATGFSVTAVSTAEQGLAALGERRYRLLLTDFALPGEDGGWLIHQGRRRGLLRGTGVLLVTALLRPPTLDGVLTLRKPIGLAELLAAIRRVCAPDGGTPHHGADL